MQDTEIIALFFARSEQAIAELAAKHGAVCRRVAENILGSAQDAEECVNDAYLGVWNTVPPQRPDPLRTYVCRIVRNLATARYHTNRAQKRSSIYDTALDELEDCLASADTAQTALDARELTALLDRFLVSLREDERVLFVRRYWYADSVAALAGRFGIRENTAAVRLARTREKLRNYLKKEGYDL